MEIDFLSWTDYGRSPGADWLPSASIPCFADGAHLVSLDLSHTLSLFHTSISEQGANRQTPSYSLLLETNPQSHVTTAEEPPCVGMYIPIPSIHKTQNILLAGTSPPTAKPSSSLGKEIDINQKPLDTLTNHYPWFKDLSLSLLFSSVALGPTHRRSVRGRKRDSCLKPSLHGEAKTAGLGPNVAISSSIWSGGGRGLLSLRLQVCSLHWRLLLSPIWTLVLSLHLAVGFRSSTVGLRYVRLIE